MPELSKDIIGKELASYDFRIERGKLKEFCLAIHEQNPIYWDKEAAKEAGYEDSPLPPTFQTTFSFWGYPKLFEDMKELGIDTKRLLHMKEEYTYHKALHPETNVKAKLKVSDVKIGKMNMVTFHSDFSNEEGELCIAADMSIVIVPE